MQLGDLVSGTPFVCGPDATLAEVASGLADRDHGSVGVISDRDLVGLITERDLTQAIAAGADLGAEPVRRWMTADPDTFAPEVDVYDAAEWLIASGYRHLPVMSGSELLGIVSVRDLLGAVLEGLDEEE